MNNEITTFTIVGQDGQTFKKDYDDNSYKCLIEMLKEHRIDMVMPCKKALDQAVLGLHIRLCNPTSVDAVNRLERLWQTLDRIKSRVPDWDILRINAELDYVESLVGDDDILIESIVNHKYHKSYGIKYKTNVYHVECVDNWITTIDITEGEV